MNSGLNGNTWQAFHAEADDAGIPAEDLRGVVSNGTLVALLDRADRRFNLLRHGGQVDALLERYTTLLADVTADEAGYTEAHASLGSGASNEFADGVACALTADPTGVEITLNDDSWSEFVETAGDMGVDEAIFSGVDSNAALRTFLSTPAQVARLGDDELVANMVWQHKKAFGIPVDEP